MKFLKNLNPRCNRILKSKPSNQVKLQINLVSKTISYRRQHPFAKCKNSAMSMMIIQVFKKLRSRMQISLLYYLLSKSKRSLEKINLSSNNSSSIENRLENQILKILMKSGKELEVTYGMEGTLLFLQPNQCGEP